MSAAGRDARHLALARIGAEGQSRIAAGSALVVGAGGIGCAASLYLAAAGVGRIVLSDFDRIDATNLGRQILYGPDDLGKSKVRVAGLRLAARNADVRVETLDGRLDGTALEDAVRSVDIVLDGTDNFATRFGVSDACVRAGRTLVSGAAIRFEGQLVVFGPDYSTSPCYRCLYTEADESLENCAGNGVLGPVPGVIGTMMAVETLKRLAGITSTSGTLSLYDAMSGDLRRIAVGKRADCTACR